PAVASAEAKLERVMPEPVKQKLKDVHRTIRFEFANRGPAASKRILSGLATAAHGRRRVRLTYAAGTGEATEREFDPYGLSYRRGRWYAVGFCHLRADLRTFRLDRVQAVAPTPATFERPERFDVIEYLGKTLASLRRARPFEVVLKTDLETALALARDEAELLEPCDGGVRLRSSTDDFERCARHLAWLPFAFEVRDPPELGDAVRELGRKLVGAVVAPPPEEPGPEAANPHAGSGLE